MHSTPARIEFVRSLCERRELTVEAARQQGNAALIDWLWEIGVFDCSG
jgi:hypothetical protein